MKNTYLILKSLKRKYKKDFIKANSSRIEDSPSFFIFTNTKACDLYYQSEVKLWYINKFSKEIPDCKKIIDYLEKRKETTIFSDIHKAISDLLADVVKLSVRYN